MKTLPCVLAMALAVSASAEDFVPAPDFGVARALVLETLTAIAPADSHHGEAREWVAEARSGVEARLDFSTDGLETHTGGGGSIAMAFAPRPANPLVPNAVITDELDVSLHTNNGFALGWRLNNFVVDSAAPSWAGGMEARLAVDVPRSESSVTDFSTTTLFAGHTPFVGGQLYPIFGLDARFRVYATSAASIGRAIYSIPLGVAARWDWDADKAFSASFVMNQPFLRQVGKSFQFYAWPTFIADTAVGGSLSPTFKWVGGLRFKSTLAHDGLDALWSVGPFAGLQY